MRQEVEQLKPRTTLPILAGLFFAFFIDTPQKISLGPVSLSGGLTLALAVGLLFLSQFAFYARFAGYNRSISRIRQPIVQRTWTAVPWTLSLFLTWATVRLLISPSIQGLQNVALYSLFVLSILIVATFSSEGTAEWALERFAWVAVAVTLIFIVCWAAGIEFYNERPYAAASVIFMAVLVPFRTKNLILRFAPYLVLIGVVISLSRAAAAICLVLLGARVLRGRRGARLAKGIAWIGTLAAAGITVIWNYAPFRDRFFGGDNAVVLDNGLTLNTSGRDTLWRITIESWLNNPWFGNGAGSSQAVITPLFRNIEHPHNEYLRLLNDFGIVGAVLFFCGLATLVAMTLRRARHYDQPHHWTAVLVLVAIFINSFTGNPLISHFVMVPAAVLIGLSLASPPPPRKKSTEAAATRPGSRVVL